MIRRVSSGQAGINTCSEQMIAWIHPDSIESQSRSQRRKSRQSRADGISGTERLKRRIPHMPFVEITHEQTHVAARPVHHRHHHGALKSACPRVNSAVHRDDVQCPRFHLEQHFKRNPGSSAGRRHLVFRRLADGEPRQDCIAENMTTPRETRREVTGHAQAVAPPIEKLSAFRHRVIDEFLQRDAIGIDTAKRVELSRRQATSVHADSAVDVVRDYPDLRHGHWFRA